MKYKHAKDLMIPLHGHISPDETIREASLKLRKTRRDEARVGVKGLPVIDSCSKLVGFLSMGDILKAVFPNYLSMDKNLGEFTWDGMLESFAHKAAERKVSDVMTKKVVTVSSDAPLMECIEHMLNNNVKRLLVMDDAKVIGILYERDIFETIADNLK